MTVSGRRLVLIILVITVLISAWAARTIFDLRRKVGHTAVLPAEKLTPSGPMTLIPYGYALVDEDNLPMQLPAFYIHRTEVTNAAYARRDAAPELPVVNVTFDEARRFCESQGLRLPQPQEWEKAARGEKGSRWPWGSQDDPARANLSHPSGGLLPADSLPEGASVYGVLNLSGNAWEWVDDRHTPMPRNLQTLARLLSPLPSPNEPWYAARGGAFDTPLAEALPYKYLVLPARYRAPNLGFRCAVSASVQ